MRGARAMMARRGPPACPGAPTRSRAPELGRRPRGHTPIERRLAHGPSRGLMRSRVASGWPVRAARCFAPCHRWLGAASSARPGRGPDGPKPAAPFRSAAHASRRTSARPLPRRRSARRAAAIGARRGIPCSAVARTKAAGVRTMPSAAARCAAPGPKTGARCPAVGDRKPCRRRSSGPRARVRRSASRRTGASPPAPRRRVPPADGGAVWLRAARVARMRTVAGTPGAAPGRTICVSGGRRCRTRPCLRILPCAPPRAPPGRSSARSRWAAARGCWRAIR